MTLFQRIRKKGKDRKGFTLGELLIVVAIIGVLVSISIPIFADQKYKAEVAVTKANVRSLYSQMVASYLLDPSGEDPGCIKRQEHGGAQPGDGLYYKQGKQPKKGKKNIDTITVTLNNGTKTVYKFYHLGFTRFNKTNAIWEANETPYLEFYILDKTNTKIEETITYGEK